MKKTKAYLPLRCFLWVIAGILLFHSSNYAQDKPPGVHTIKGKVVSKSTGDAMPLATIAIKGTTTQVATDANGNFSIDAKPGDVLVVSSVGFAKTEMKLGNATTLDIRMEQDYNRMEDVIVVGYGRMKKTDMSSSQVTVTAADLQKTVNTTFDQALQGRAANVNVVSNSGQPGAPPSVMIRGFNSINGTNQPLYVIDGVQFKPDDPRTLGYTDDPKNAGRSAQTSGVASNFLSSVNTDDIETINVLQGPSATSIYGAAGANGVIMITTKRGKAGDTKMTLNSLFTLQDLPKFADVMNLREWATYRNAYAAAGAAAAQPEFADPSTLGDGTNWQRALFRRTLLHKDVLSLSGGTDKTTFYLSGEYFNQQGVAIGSGFERYSLRLNLDNQTRRWLKLGTNLNVSQTKEIVNTVNKDIINTAIGQNPSVPVKNPDGSWGGPVNTQFQYTNPVALASVNDNKDKSISFNGGMYMDITPLKGLVFHVDGNSYIQAYNQYVFNPSYTFGGYKNTTTVSYRTRGQNYWWGFNQRLQYQTQIGEHNFNIMAGHEAQESGYESLYGRRDGYLTNTIPELSAGSTLTEANNSAKGISTKESYFGRFNYVFRNRYILQGTYRADASSNFGPNYKWGYFPALSAAWRISEEPFMKNITAVNDLKLRMEYGESGNENATGYYSTMTAVPTTFGDGSGFIPNVYSNPNLHWETTKTYDIGFDLHMFGSRLEVIADVYQKDISNLLTRNDHSYYFGGAVTYDIASMQWPTSNIGSMRDQGIGITVNTVNIERPFTWKTGVNFSLDRNKITYLDQGTPFNVIYKTSSVATLSKVGSPAALFTSYIADGLFTDIKDIQGHAVQTATKGVLTIDPSTGSWVGDIKFRDQNGDKVIDEKDRVVVGNPWPKFTMGFNNSFSYKNFDLNIFLYGNFGNDVYNYLRYRNENTGGTAVYSNLFKSVSDFARPSNVTAGATTATLTNPGHQIARIAPGDPNGNTRASQWYIEDGSFIKCKNIAVSYALPRSLLSSTFIRGAKVSVNAQNLFTITHYSGLDPEIGQNGPLMYGVDDGRYPSSRMYSFNLLLDF